MIHSSRYISYALLTVGLFVAGCSGAEGVEDGDATETVRVARVETLVLQPTTFEDEISLTGTVEAPNDATLSAQAAGTLRMLKPLGTFVRRGEAVGQIDAGMTQAAVAQAQAALESAEAQFALAQDNYQRQEPLYQDSIISALEFENVRAGRNQARAAVAQAKAALDQAQMQRGYTRLTAPFSGIVEEHYAEVGEQITPGMPVARVVSTANVKVRAGVPERYAGDIEVGTPVVVRFNAYGLENRRGTVTFAGSAINPSNRTFPIEVSLDNASGQLKPEMVVELSVRRRELQKVLVVPQSIVVREETGNSVFTVVQTDTATVAQRQAVTIGVGSNGRVVVTSGLDSGDQVVVQGQTNLVNGEPVEVASRFSSIEEASAFVEEAR